MFLVGKEKRLMSRASVSLSREAACLTLLSQHDPNNFRPCDNELVASSLWLAYRDPREYIQSSLTF